MFSPLSGKALLLFFKMALNNRKSKTVSPIIHMQIFINAKK